MIFPKLYSENIVQVEDKLRLDASSSFSNAEEITDVLIKPSFDDLFVSVFSTSQENWFLDWAYETEGLKEITVRIETSLSDKERTFEIEVKSQANDPLFSKDGDLYPYEPDLKKYLPVGKSSFIYAHRAAREKILAYLDEQRIWKLDNSRYTVADIIAITDSEFKHQFKMWSIFQTLLIIFESAQVSNSDIFQEKREEYEKEMRIHRNRSSLRLAPTGDGTTELTPRNIRTTTLVRR